MIITVTLNPAIDKTAHVDTLVVEGLNRLNHIILDVGGKGINVSKAIKALGGNSVCTGFVAGGNGDWIKKQLDEMGINHDFQQVDGNTRTNLKVLDAQMNLTELNDQGDLIQIDDLVALKTKIFSLVKSKDIVVLAGSVPQGVAVSIYYELIVALKKMGVTVILDADGGLFEEGIKAGPSVIKPNKYELCKYFQLDESCSNEELVEEAKKLLSLGIEMIVISMGSKGALFITREAVASVEGLKIKAHSAVGAGDSMVGALAYGLNEQEPFEQLIRRSIATSAGAVMTQGTKAPELEVVNKLMKEINITFK